MPADDEFGATGRLFLTEKEGGMRLTPYYDSGHNLTIGIGHKMSTTEIADYYADPAKWNEAYLWNLFETDVARFVSYITEHASQLNLTNNQFSALVSWSFNSGCPARSGIWTGLHEEPINYVLALNTLCQYTGVGDKNKSSGPDRWQPLYPGLMNRRFDEVILFLRDMELSAISAIFGQLHFKDGSKLRRVNSWGPTPNWLTDMDPAKLEAFLQLIGVSSS